MYISGYIQICCETQGNPLPQKGNTSSSALSFPHKERALKQLTNILGHGMPWQRPSSDPMGFFHIPRNAPLRMDAWAVHGISRMATFGYRSLAGRRPKPEVDQGHLFYTTVLSIGCEPKSLLIGNGCLPKHPFNNFFWVPDINGEFLVMGEAASGRDQLLTQLQPRPTRWGLDRDSTEKKREKSRAFAKTKKIPNRLLPCSWIPGCHSQEVLDELCSMWILFAIFLANVLWNFNAAGHETLVWWERSTGFGLAALRRMRRNSLHEATVAVTRRD